jgi:hypothetical protein
VLEESELEKERQEMTAKNRLEPLLELLMLKLLKLKLVVLELAVGKQ